MTKHQKDSYLIKPFKSAPDKKTFTRLSKRFRGRRRFNQDRGGLQYPFQLLDPEQVLGEGSGYDTIFLVGSNWENSVKPICVFIGCNYWKLGFLADYLSSYRCAFLPRKKVGWDAVKIIRRLKIKPDIFVIWGKTESPILRKYLKLVGAEVWRTEDGFLRSAELGASHATPYSLVFDKKDIYYDSSKKTEIENYLQGFDSSKISSFNEKSDAALSLIVGSRLSKYNLPDFQSQDDRSIGSKVLVLGQVDNDASIKYGNPDGWSTLQLIKLASYENPGCEVIYRPHPEVYKGYQKSTIEENKIEKYAKLTSPETSLVEALDSVSRVYTISSLTGLEALFRGKEVVVVGMPFYAGWGLTDDRARCIRRTRKLTLAELFYASYILYPRYLTNLQDPYLGFLATAYKIKSDRKLLEFNTLRRMFNPGYGAEGYEKIDFSAYRDVLAWPLILDSFNKSQAKLEANYVAKLDHGKQLSIDRGEIYRRVLPYLIVGMLKTDLSRERYLVSIISSKNISYSEANELLLALCKYLPGGYLQKPWTTLLLMYNAECGGEEMSALLPQTLSEIQSVLVDHNVQGDISFALDPDLKMVYLEHKFENRDFSEILEDTAVMCLLYQNRSRLLKLLMAYCDVRFEYSSMRSFAEFLLGYDFYFSNRLAVSALFKSNNVDNFLGREKGLEILVEYVNHKPDGVDGALSHLSKFEESYLPEDKDVVLGIIDAKWDYDFNLVQAYIKLERFEEAEYLARQCAKRATNGLQDTQLVKLTQALSFNGKLDEAIDLMEKRCTSRLTSLVVAELMRLYVIAGYYHKSSALLEEALSIGVPVGDMHRRKLYFGTGNIGEAFKTFTDIGIRNRVEKYYKHKYLQYSSLAEADESVFLLSIFGPGDELRFASIYNDLSDILGTKNLSIACSPRLKSLFARSFPNIEFVPVARPRNTDDINLSDYKNVPGSDIVSVVDNRAVEAIDGADKIIFVTDLLHKAIPNKDSFKGSYYLYPREDLVNGFRALLPKDKLLVGLSWRSSLATYSRSEHYLTIFELVDAFKLAGVQFVNFQYDECSEELEWVEKNFPGKIINVDKVDHYNDFESVSALMSCMDLIISPATTVAELAGALGCRTWLFSNSSELDWRKKDSYGTDVWHNSTRIIDVEEKGNKFALANHLVQLLRAEVKKLKKKEVDNV